MFVVAPNGPTWCPVLRVEGVEAEVVGQMDVVLARRVVDLLNRHGMVDMPLEEVPPT